MGPGGGVFSLHSLENGPARDQEGPASPVSFENIIIDPFSEDQEYL